MELSSDKVADGRIDLLSIELEARRLRAEVARDMVSGLVARVASLWRARPASAKAAPVA